MDSIKLGFEARSLSVATGGPELGFPGMVPSTDRSHSLEFRVIKNVPFYGSFGGGKSDWRAPLLYNGREKPSTQPEGPPKRSLQMFPYVDCFFII
jgi:hypothetical protein